MDAVFNYKLDPANDLYNILGCDELSTTEQILTEYKIKAVNCHPDKNNGDPDAVEKFQKLQRAKEILTDEKGRNDYDIWRRSGLAIPYEDWVAKRDSMKMSMHWAVRTKKEPMIEDANHPNPPAAGESESRVSEDSKQTPSREPRVYWQRNDGSDMLNKFRNYEI